MSFTLPNYTLTFHAEGHDIHTKYGMQAIVEKVSFHGDQLKTCNKSLDFLEDPRFIRANHLGMELPLKHRYDVAKGLDNRFRLHTILWAAQQGLRLEGDFVECGVNLAYFARGICDYYDFAKVDKHFYLFDTYNGIPESQVGPGENLEGIKHTNEVVHFECYDIVNEAFADFDNVTLVQGMVPDTLTDVDIDKVAFLSIDMNLAEPEVAAMEFFWDKLVPGAVVIFDDYGWAPYLAQKRALDAFADSKNTKIMTLPTGQGLLVKQ